MTRRTILIATPYFYPRIGGLENYAYHIALGLQDNGWRVVVACGDTTVTTVTREELEGLTVYRLPIARVVSNTPLDLRWYHMLRGIIHAERPNVINAHTPVPFMVDMAALAAGRRLPLVVTYHAATLMKPGSLLLTLVTRAYLAIQRLTLRRARHVIAVSDYVKQALGPGLAAKTSVVYNAVPAAAPVRRHPAAGLVFVANLEPSHAWKGLSLIIDALGRIKAQTGTAPHLTVIGDGAARGEYENQAARLGLQNHVTFAGRQVGAERDTLMRQAAALVAYPTTANDALPTVFLEAWAQGLAIVAAAIGPIPSLIQDGHTGVLVRPNDPTALATAIAALFDDPAAIARMGAAGHQLIADKYNWPTQVKRTISVLENVL